MRLRLATTCLLLLAVSCAASPATAGDLRGVVRLDSGPVRGTQDKGGVREFLGIPYAAPPVGALRWRPPQPVAAWAQVRPATAFGAACPQPGPLASCGNEDCLTLNVWTPARATGEKLPVMVWIHGGAFNFGATSQAEYQGRNLARKGVVVVTVNYRLGPLGFMAHPQLAAESGRGVSGNYGLLDQIAALAWVQRNIAAFGGNPDNVTLFGQSAGSRSVSLQTLSPLSAGLFHKAIAQSGGPIIGSEYLSPAFNGDMASVSRMGQELAARMGCGDADDALACMRAKTAHEVVTAADCRTSIFEEGLFFAPVLDGWALPVNPLDALEAGLQRDIPMIVGSTGNEGALYLRGERDLNMGKYASFLSARFAAHAGEAFAVFPAAGPAETPAAIDRLITVAANAQPARTVARARAARSSGAYLYQFTRRPDTPLARQLGAFHGVDLAYVFGNMTPTEGYTDVDKKLAQQVMAYWVNFAKTGNPNGPGLIHWPAYDRASDMSVEFSDSILVRQHLYAQECDFIDRVSRFQPATGQGK